jgi:hypothetical protein
MTNSFSYRVDPIGTEKLGSGDKAKSYISKIPAVWLAAENIRRLANQFTVQFSGQVGSVDYQPYTSRTIVSGIHRSVNQLEYDATKLRDHSLANTLVTSCLLGKRYLSVCSFNAKEETTSYYYEKTEWTSPLRVRKIKVTKGPTTITDIAMSFLPVNVHTGELYEPNDIPTLLEPLDYNHLTYTLDHGKIGLLLSLPEPLIYSKAIPHLRQLTRDIKNSIGISIDIQYSTLFTKLPIPLTVTMLGHYCNLIGVSAHDSDEAIESYLSDRKRNSHTYTILTEPVSSPQSTDQYNDEDASERQWEEDLAEEPEEDDFQWFLPGDYVVGKRFFDGLTNILKSNAPSENTTPKKLTETRKLLGYILFSEHKDNEGHLILSSEAICKALYGSTKRARGNNFNLSATLSLLSPLATIETNKHSYKNNLATTLKSIEFTHEFNEIWNEERKKLRKDLVWLSNGKSTLSHQSAILAYQREKAQNSITLYPCEISEKLMYELNNEKANVYTKIYNEGICTALLMADEMKGQTNKNNHSALDKIRLQPIPIYHRTEKTNRLAQSGGFFSLSGSIRNRFFSGYWMADISHCQLSINSYLWGCERMQEKLKEGNVWEYLCASSGLSKVQVKAAVYKVMYGKSTKIRKNSHLSLLNNIEEIAALIESKSTYIQQIVRDGFVFDAYENRISVNEFDVASKISSVSQSYEFLLLQDIFQHYLDTHKKDTSKSFQILLYTVDGFIYSCDSRNEKSVSSLISEKFQQKAKSIGIFTNLEICKL